MSFFRVLLALLISGGIAYGLYRYVETQNDERSVEAVRTEIEEPAGTGAVTLAETASTDTDEGEGAETQGSTGAPEEADATVTESASGTEGSETAETTAEPESTETATAPETEDATGNASGETASAETSDEAGADAEPETATGQTEDPSATPETAASFAERTDENIENQQASVAEPAEEPEAEAQESGVAALPAVELADATSGSVDALKIVTGGMTYREALGTLVDAGWQPRTETGRASQEGEPNAAEAALLEAGYAELEGCKGDERPICRFEFVDGAKRIAAVITAGTGSDPDVIDAFLMDIQAQ